MNFDYSEEQRLLKDQARRFLDAECPVAAVRRVLDEPAPAFDENLWTQVAELGWTGVTIPEAYGGSGLGHVHVCAIAEELGRALAPIPFVSTVYLFVEALVLAGSDAQKRRLLPQVAAGDLVGCLAVAEGPGALAADRLGARVAGGRLSGIKRPVTDGGVAGHAVVRATGEAGPGLYLVDLNAAGVTCCQLATLDPTRGIAELRFDDVDCEPLGEPGEGEALLERILERAAVPVAFEQVGGAERCLEMAKAFAMQRYAFGRPIAGNQAIKHKLADMYAKKELARSNAYYAAWALQSDAAELPRAAATARVAATLAYEFAARENLQTHGGMGFTWEVDCHLHLRRSRQLALCLGGLPVWRERLVRALEQTVIADTGA